MLKTMQETPEGRIQNCPGNALPAREKFKTCFGCGERVRLRPLDYAVTGFVQNSFLNEAWCRRGVDHGE